MAINFQTLMSEFSEDISNRTGLLTEDSIRYYVFKAFLSQDPVLDNYTLELPYDSITPVNKNNPYFVQLPEKDGLGRRKGKLEQELDLFHFNNGEPICMEIKFHRHPSDINFPMPQAAGSLFNDLRRLQLFNSTDGRKIHRLFFYVTDSLMNNYFEGGGNEYRNALKDFYSIKDRECFEFSELKNKTFKLASSKSFEDKDAWRGPLKLKLLWGNPKPITCESDSIRGDIGKKLLHIRLYEVL